MARGAGPRDDDPFIDWLAFSPDLPHLIARLSELVLRDGYDPGDLVVLPREEVTRREASSFSAGWAEAVREELPEIRRDYERHVAQAYARGETAGRTGHRGGSLTRGPRVSDRRGEDADVIPLPLSDLLRPPRSAVMAEERAEREQERFAGRRAQDDVGEVERELVERERRVARTARQVLGHQALRPASGMPWDEPSELSEVQVDAESPEHQHVQDFPPAGAASAPAPGPTPTVPSGPAGGQRPRPGQPEPRLSERARALVDDLQERVARMNPEEDHRSAHPNSASCRTSGEEADQRLR